MSTSYGIVGYPDVPRGDAAAVLQRCEAALRAGLWIGDIPDPEAAYAPKGPCFRPDPDGPAGDLLSYTVPRTGETVAYAINGVVLCGPTYINHGPFIATPSFLCPSCGGTLAQDGPQAEMQQERCFDLLGRYFESEVPLRKVACVLCEAEVDLNDLVQDGPPTFIVSDVAIEFWQWPPRQSGRRG